MLTQETIVDIHVRHRQGDSIRAIAKELDLSRNTVRRYLRNKSLKPGYCERPKTITKLDDYKAYIIERINAAKPHWIPATVLLNEIQQRGYSGGITQLKLFTSPFKQPALDPIVRFETPSGRQMQVDFTTIIRGKVKIKAFVATLGYSRASYVRFSLYEKQDDWLRGIEEAMIYFGGVPQEILFDNAKAIMIERDAYGEGEHKWNAKLLEQSVKYGYKARACRPYRAKTKGKVERFNSYLKQSYITPLVATMNQLGLTLTVDIANAHVGPWLADVAHQRIHGTTGIKPQVLLDQERHDLLPLPAPSRPVIVSNLSATPMPVESLQHPLAIYDRLLEVRL
jgi:transposase